MHCTFSACSSLICTIYVYFLVMSSHLTTSSLLVGCSFLKQCQTVVNGQLYACEFVEHSLSATELSLVLYLERCTR